MKILHTTLTIDGSSGVVTFVRELDTRLRKHGIESEIRTLNDPNNLKYVNCDVLHIHGLWLRMYHKAAQWAKKNNIPIVWSTHGMTAPWSMRHKWWKKIPAWWLYQKQDLNNAFAIHCTTEQEVKWNKNLGLNNCFIVPLGTTIKTINKYPIENNQKILLFVGRIYPVKGLVNLIEAWNKIISSTDFFTNKCIEKWKLRIVGPDESGHLTTLLSLVKKYKLESRVEFTGPKFEEELRQEYENCECLILPSFTENFGATVIDALAHGKPCIASTFTPWQELNERKCGWWVSNEPTSLANTIYEMMTIGNNARHEMGARGHALVQEKYTWDAVIDKMINEYKVIINKK